MSCNKKSICAKCFAYMLISTLFLLAGCGAGIIEPPSAPETTAEPPATTEGETVPATWPQAKTEPPASPDDQAEAPFMWRITAPSGQAMYMYGSIHAASADLYPLSDVVMNAFCSSDSVAIELWDPQGPSLAQRYAYEDGRTLTDDIPQALYQRAISFLEEYGKEYLEQLEQTGISLETLHGYKPWLTYTCLSAVAVEGSSISALNGLDSYFLMQAFSRSMEVLPTDDPAEIHAALLGYAMPLQIKLIESVLDIDSYIEGIEGLYKAWVTGDDQGAVDAFNTDLARIGDDTLAEAYVDVLLTQRNIRMADMAEAYMAEGKQVFFIVGAFHLLGEDSVINVLIDRGYDAERIR